MVYPLRNNNAHRRELELLELRRNILLMVDDANSVSFTNMTTTVADMPHVLRGRSAIFRSPSEASYLCPGIHWRFGVDALRSGGIICFPLPGTATWNTGRNTSPRCPPHVTSPILEKRRHLKCNHNRSRSGESIRLIVNWGDSSSLTTNTVLGPGTYNLSHPYPDDGLSDTSTEITRYGSGGGSFR